MLENPVESILKDKGPLGMSLKQLSYLMGVPIRRVLFHINYSTKIKHTDPLLHGSLKGSIHVYSLF